MIERERGKKRERKREKGKGREKKRGQGRGGEEKEERERKREGKRERRKIVTPYPPPHKAAIRENIKNSINQNTIIFVASSHLTEKF